MAIQIVMNLVVNSTLPSNVPNADLTDRVGPVKFDSATRSVKV
jgi:hypothetical protein